jgi:chorismate-pyruvate lyase
MTRSTDQTPTALPRDELCAVMGVTLADVQPLAGERLPQPYRKLLVHDSDMTPTLEAFHACTLALHVINKQFIDGTLVRQVLLVSDRTNKPVAYGVIRIFLDSFDESARQMIIACRKPLGSILGSQAIEHFSRPTSFFALPPDETIASALRIDDPPAQLFGRYNELFHDTRHKLAQVVEILAPADAKA